VIFSPGSKSAFGNPPPYFWCHDCSQLHGVDPEFDELRDPETGDPIERTEVSAA
jgi:hypothetical protein